MHMHMYAYMHMFMQKGLNMSEEDLLKKYILNVFKNDVFYQKMTLGEVPETQNGF